MEEKTAEPGALDLSGSRDEAPLGLTCEDEPALRGMLELPDPDDVVPIACDEIPVDANARGLEEVCDRTLVDIGRDTADEDAPDWFPCEEAGALALEDAWERLPEETPAELGALGA